MNLSKLLLLSILSLGLGLSACQKKEESPMEKAADAIGDATNTRDNEKLKDAAEDAKSAVDNAAEGLKDAVKGDDDK